MITRITRRLEFDAGHRVLRHESKCAHLHGHRYVVEVTVSARDGELDDLGRVIDFGVVKQILGKWIDDNWDHNILLNSEDPLLEVMRLPDVQSALRGSAAGQYDVFAGKTPFVFHGGRNPTAENIAHHLLWISNQLLPPSIVVLQVRVYETPNCWADAFRGT